MQIGSVLREARESQGLSLEEVAQKTKIRTRYLEALERDAYDLLPGRVYVKGFLRSYARFLGVSEEVLVSRFEEHFPPEETPPLFEDEPENKPRYLLYALAVLILGVALIFGVNLLKGGRAETDLQPKKPPVQVDPVSIDNKAEEHPAQEQDSSHKTPPPKSGINLVLKVTRESCWMRVVVDGETRFVGELKANQSKSFWGSERIQVKLGNAGAVFVQVDGRDLGYLGALGDVVRREFVASGEG